MVSLHFTRLFFSIQQFLFLQSENRVYLEIRDGVNDFDQIALSNILFSGGIINPVY
jgi:hypothetical protein